MHEGDRSPANEESQDVKRVSVELDHLDMRLLILTTNFLRPDLRLISTLRKVINE